MKKYIYIIAVLVLFVNTINAQIATGYEVSTWYGFKKVAISYTFDDGTSNQIPVIVPLLNQYNYKATFNEVINWTGSWSNWQTLANNGQEIASHTITHPSSLATMSITDQDTEYKNSQSTIKTNTGSECITIAYPNCITGDKTTLAKYYIAGRICDGNIASNNPSDFFNIGSIICGSEGAMKTAQNFNDKISSAVSAKGWCVFLIHGIDGDGGYSSLSSTEFGSHLSYVNTNASTYWVAPFGTVAKYIKERNALAVAETTITADSLRVVATHTLSSTLTTYNLPITIRRELPSGWTSASVYNNTTKITSTIVTEGGKTYVVFDVVPNAGNMYIAKSTGTGGTTTTFTELVSNGEFDSGTTGWSTYNNGTAQSTLSVTTSAGLSGTNAGSICPNASNYGTSDWHIQLYQNVTLEADKEYTFSFMAKAATARTITVMFQQIAADYAVYKSFTYNLTTTAQTFTETFTLTGTVDAASKLTFCVGNNASCVMIDKVSFGYTTTSGSGDPGTGGETGGQGAYYTDVYRNLFKEYLGKTDAEVTTKINSVWDHFFVNSTNKVYFESTNNTAYIMDIGNSDVRTEGMSYGMMICVQMNKQTEFDKLWKWAKTYMLYTSGDWSGYFAWQCNTDGSKKNGNSTSCAPDGEAYFITALFFASHRWGNTGTFNYEQEAQSILNNIMKRSSSGTNGVYNMFNANSKLITFVPYGDSYTHTDPSYNLPGFLELWARWSTTNTAFWQQAVTASRTLLKNSSHSTTGLFPDYSAFDGTPFNPSWKTDYDAKRYQYDAIRCAMNVGVDYHWFRVDTTNQEAMMLRLLQFFKSKNYANGQYAWDGSSPTGSYSEGMAGSNGVGVFALRNNNTLATEYMTRLWNTSPPTGTWRYYNGMVYFLSMLNCAGMFKVWKPACTAPATPTVTTPVTYCQNATATALTATGTGLKWYTVATGGTGSSTAPTPSTTTVGSTTYYVSQTVSGCESSRASIVVTITSAPSAPTVTTPVTYAQNATATALTATGTALKWYTVATGGTGSSTAPIPSTTTLGSTTYYVSQTVSTCESSRAAIVVTINPAILTQTISLQSGWNFISINVNPADSSIATIFSGKPMTMVKNADGFWKTGQNASLQSLTHVQAGKGYLVQMTAAASISVQGTAVNTVSYSFPITAGWHMIGCPYQTATNLTSLFTSGNTDTVKDFNGYWTPGDALSTISTLAPGKGYYWRKK